MKRLSLILCAILAVSVISGCGDVVVQKEASRRASTGESWTIMMYMCGSTLEENDGIAGEVLRSLPCDLPQNVNVLVETGGCRDWSIDDVDNEYPQYYIVQKNGLRLANQVSPASMGESSTLSNFIKWSAESYPADHYMAIIWDHGGGPLGGVAYDSNYGYDSLSVRELRSAFGSSGIYMDLIVFDASLTATIDMAAAVSMYADYMVASEGVMPMSGWDYEDLFCTVSDNPNSTGLQIGQEMCIAAAEKASEKEAELMSLAVVDLSKETMLSLAFDGVAQTLADATGTAMTLGTLRTALSGLEPIGANTQWEGYSNIADIGELTSALEGDFGSPVTNLKNALSEAVVCKYTGKVRSGMGGLGFWYPFHRDGAEIAKYRDISGSARYIEYLEKTAIDVDVPERAADLGSSGAFLEYMTAAETNTISAAADIEGRLVMAASRPELITSAYVNIYKYDPKESKYIFLCSDHNTAYDEAAGGYVYSFDGKLSMMGRTNVTMYPVSRGAMYDIYSVPVMFDGEPVNIRVLKYAEEDGKYCYNIIGIWKGNDPFMGTPDRTLTRLKTGDVITPLYEVFGENRYVEGRRVRIGFGGIKLEERKIPDGEYALSFVAEDIYGIKKESNTASLTVSGGSIHITTN
ncbi:MAG: hypothetical protein IJH37_01080 [Clostridia bacterium]|nr:hypothetical protein [Clostridia bacterium]